MAGRDLCLAGYRTVPNMHTRRYEKQTKKFFNQRVYQKVCYCLFQLVQYFLFAFKNTAPTPNKHAANGRITYLK